MKPRRNLFLGTLVVIALNQATTAATYNWNGATTGGETGISDSWDTATANWTGAATTWPAVSTLDDDAVFGGTGGAVIIDAGGVTANDINFASDFYTLSGGGITLDGTTPTITTADGTLTEISSVISGAAGLTKAGTGDLILSGANNYTGVTTLSAGTLIAGNSAALGSNVGGTTVTSGAALDVNGRNLGTEVVTISGDGPFGDGAIVNSGGVQINALGRIVLGANATIGGGVRWDLRNSGPSLDMGGFTLTKTGSNYLGLIGTAINNPGNIVVDSGELSISTSTNLGGSSTNAATVNLGGVLSFYQSSSQHAWTLNLNDGSTLRGENGGGAQNTWGGPVNVDGEVTLQANGILNLPSNITGTANLTKTGNSTAILSGTNSITSTDLSIFAGSLQINSAVSLPNAPSISVFSGANGALVLGNNITVGSGKTITIAGGGAGGFYGAISAATGNTGTSEWQGGVIIRETTGTRLGSLGGILHISGDISETDAGSALAIRSDENVNSTVILSGNNSFSGTLTLSAAGLRIGSVNALGAGPLFVDNGGRIVSLSSTDSTARDVTTATTLNGTGVLTLGDATRNGKLTFSDINLGTGTRRVAVASEVEFAGAISNTGGIVKSGTGTLTLSADNSYSGATAVVDGTLKLDYTTNTGGKLSDTAALTLSGGTLELAGDPAVAEEVASTTLGSNSFSSVTRSSGTGVLQMNAITRQSGATIDFAQGGIATTDTLNTNGILGTWATVGGVDWAVNSTDTNDGPITALSTYTQTSIAGDTATNYGSVHITVDSNQTVGADITPHSLRFNDAGAYTLTLQGTNVINSGGILVTSGVGDNQSTITGGILTLPTTGGNLVINQVNTANILVIGSEIANNTGAVSILKIGPGEAEFTATNTYTGGITVNGGTLTLSGNQATQNAGVVVGNLSGTSATLNIAGDLPMGGSNTISVGVAEGADAVINQTAGTVSFAGGNQLLIGNAATGVYGSSGTYNLSGGTLNTLNIANRGVMIGVNAGAPGKLINATFNLSGTGVLNNAGVLQVVRGDSGTPFQNSTYNQTGGTSTNGTLLIGGNSGNGANSIATFSVTGGTFSAGVFSNLSRGNYVSSTMTIGGTAVVTLPPFPTARGAGSTATLYFDGGVLKPTVSSTAYLGGLTNAFIQDGGVAFDTSGFNITVSQSLLEDSGSTGGGLTKTGNGTLTLTGNNTFTGGVTLSRGAIEIGNANALGTGPFVNNTTNPNTLTNTTGSAVTLACSSYNISSSLIIGGNSSANDINTGTGTMTLVGTDRILAVNTGTTVAIGGEVIGSLRKDASGTLVLAGASDDDLSSLRVVQGTLQLTGSTGAATQLTMGHPTGGNVGKFVLGGSGGAVDQTFGQLQTNGSAQESQSIVGGNASVSTLTIDQSTDTTYAGTLGGAGTDENNLALVKSGTGTLSLNGANTYTGNTTVSGGTLVIGATGSLLFSPTTNGTTNSLGGTGTVNYDGTLSLDLGSADATAGNSWLLVDVGTLTESFGGTFAVSELTLGAFTESSPGVWEITDSGKTWTFDESTGTLSVVDASGDDYTTWANGFTPPVGAKTGDDDGDGLSNFEEYAFGLDPQSGSSVNPITQQLDKGTGQFKYTRRATPGTTGVTYTYESSLDLSAWPGFTPDAEVSDLASPVEEITVTVPAALLSNPKLFIHVKASQP